MKEQRNTNIPASYVILKKNNEILMLRRANTGYCDGQYSFPAGHVEKNESLTQCAIREAKEEIGIILRAEDIKVAHIMHRKTSAGVNNQRIDGFFVADKREGDVVNKEPDKCDDLSWFDIDNLPPNAIGYIRQAIEAIKNNVFYSEEGRN